MTILQIQTQKWCRCRRRRCWNQIVMCVRSATRDSRGTRTFRCTGAATRCRGSCWRGRVHWWRRECSFALSLPACTMTPPMLSGISLVSRSTSEENTAITSNGSASAAPKVMQCTLIIKHISKPVAPEATLAIVAAFSQGRSSFLNYNSLLLSLFFFRLYQFAALFSFIYLGFDL